MRKLLILISFICLLILIVSTSKTSMKVIAMYRFSDLSKIKTDQYRFGDLYGFSWLPEFKIKLDTHSNISPIKIQVKPNVNLFVVCDSYLWGFIDTINDFNGVNNYKYIRWNDWTKNGTFIIDSNQINTLVIEANERIIMDVINEGRLYSKLNIKKDSYCDKKEWDTEQLGYSSIIYNPKIESNLEFNLFSYTVFTPIKEWKAELNRTFFNRIDKEVSLSKNKDYLFIKSTTDTSSLSSSFNSLSNNEVEIIVTEMNRMSDFYKKAGMNEVYFSFTPNPVSIIEKDQPVLNHLIDRIQDSPNRTAKTIYINKQLLDSDYDLFYHSDTHWNYTGYTIWLNEMNAILYRLCTDSTAIPTGKFK